MTLRLNGSTSGYVELEAPATAASNTLTLPNGNGSSGQYLQTNGSGTLSWQTVTDTTTNLTRLTSVALTNQTSVDFTSLPSGIRKLYLVLDGINCSSNGNLQVQLGDSGGLETSGYVSGSRVFYSNTNSTYQERSDSFVVFEDNGDWYKNGIVEIINITGNRWVSAHTVYYSERGQFPGATSNGGGRKGLSGELTQLRFTLSAGNFTAGNVNLLYEV